jgi:hypothetical protein
MKKILTSALVLVAISSSVLATSSPAMAQYYERGPRWDRRGPPPPPPPRRHRHNDGAIIVGGLAAGVIGGLIGGALANNGPRYVEPPPPPPRCWYEDQRVPNAYNSGWHYESVRVCR